MKFHFVHGKRPERRVSRGQGGYDNGLRQGLNGVANVRTGYNGDDTWNRLCGACINPLDAGVRVLAPYKNEMKHPGNNDIGEILALAGCEPIVFFAIELPADPALLLCNVAH